MAPENDTEERILEAARDLLVSEGLAGFSMRKIGREVGVSAAAIYRHFDGKDALLSAAVRKGALVFTSYLVQALGEPDARSRLLTMCERYFAFAEEHFSDYQLLFMIDNEKIGYKKLDQRAHDATSHTFQLLVDRVTECQSAGVLRPEEPTEQAIFIWTSIHGLASVWMTGHMQVEESLYRHLIRAQTARILEALKPLPSPPS